ncbi:heavy-metal-associated domain-containing protein [Euzebya rosea]|uniref:heavy-metal-associated domain-containing protein n=1 Tax=Euzebya rosea TaxID=2052804 RepID=UPI000D3EDD7D|nr:heavy metal-associated domain-containing protein [Euzebya rosea]
MTTQPTTTTVTIDGMTCGHCAATIRDAVSPLAGVTNVDVSVRSRAMTVRTDGPADLEAITAAVRDAGYEVTS